MVHRIVLSKYNHFEFFWNCLHYVLRAKRAILYLSDMAKDNFSQVALAYSQYRPAYPDEMLRFILSQVTDFEKALDIATGSGQVAVELASHFKFVFATDISSNQIEFAAKRPNIHYSIGAAEKLDFS